MTTAISINAAMATVRNGLVSMTSASIEIIRAGSLQMPLKSWSGLHRRARVAYLSFQQPHEFRRTILSVSQKLSDNVSSFTFFKGKDVIYEGESAVEALAAEVGTDAWWLGDVALRMDLRNGSHIVLFPEADGAYLSAIAWRFPEEPDTITLETVTSE
jgi:hypothetical protein